MIDSRTLQQSPRLFIARFWVAALGGIAIWVIVADSVSPWLLGLLHSGQLPGGDLLMGGRGRVPLTTYVAAWSHMADSVTFVLLTTAILTFLGLIVVSQRTPESPDVGEPREGWRYVVAVVLAAGWFGLMIGLGETYYQAARIYVLQRGVPQFRRYSHDSLWMAPLVMTVSLAVVGGVSAGVATLAGRRIPPRAVVAIALFIGLFAWADQTRLLARWATALLAAGASVRISRVAEGPARYLRLMRRTGVASLLIVGILVGLTTRVPAARERRALNRLAPTPDRPNVLLIVLDTQGASHTSLFPTARRTTPGLERWADRALVFDRAYSTSSWTLPSHATMFTGRHNFELKTDQSTPLGGEFPTLAEVLAGEGYRTAGFVGNTGYASDYFGLARGFHRYRDQPRSMAMAFASSALSRRLLAGC